MVRFSQHVGAVLCYVNIQWRETSPHTHYYFKIWFNIIFQSTPTSPSSLLAFSWKD